MSELKCGKCGQEYEFEEFMNLSKVQAVETDDNPKKQHGFTSVCSKCGYVFHKDKWRLRETIEIKFNGKVEKIDVSSVFLEINHNGYWYETMTFPHGDIECSYQDRFKTQEEAEANHKNIVQMLKKGKFKMISSNEDKLELVFKRRFI